MRRAQNSLSASTFSREQPLSWDVDGNSFLRNRASSDSSKVEMDSNSIWKTVPRCFLSCEAETDRDTHLRVASSLATATIRRRLSYIRTRRTLWKLTGRSWTSPSRCRQELNPQIQEGTQRRRWSTDCRMRTNVKQLCETIVRSNEMFKDMNHTKDPDAVHVRVGTWNSDVLTEACAQRNNESLANAATAFIRQESLDALKLVIEQLSQFYKTSAKVTVEPVQYVLDSTYKAVQEEWTEIEGMIQSEFE